MSYSSLVQRVWQLEGCAWYASADRAEVLDFKAEKEPVVRKGARGEMMMAMGARVCNETGGDGGRRASQAKLPDHEEKPYRAEGNEEERKT